MLEQVSWIYRRPAEDGIRIIFDNDVAFFPIPQDLFVCDVCNAEIDFRPVPVITGYAYCAECCRQYFGFDPRNEHPEQIEVK
ncbi:hypothetical protein [Desulfoscipio geothermicus]|uniref:hypothetical protein n=1 Tax=Desulfoscipio geothermicus TaxID=39060 RepID=UPI000B84A422|nr:hypothetical protein [Desulfoscipio geothermicus]